MPDKEINREAKTGMNYASMADFSASLDEIIQDLISVEQKATELITFFDSMYEGDANVQIEAFVAVLYSHMERLILFYTKMKNYIDVTVSAFQDNDSVMADKLGDFNSFIGNTKTAGSSPEITFPLIP